MSGCEHIRYNDHNNNLDINSVRSQLGSKPFIIILVIMPIKRVGLLLHKFAIRLYMNK